MTGAHPPGPPLELVAAGCRCKCRCSCAVTVIQSLSPATASYRGGLLVDATPHRPFLSGRGLPTPTHSDRCSAACDFILPTPLEHAGNGLQLGPDKEAQLLET